MITTDFILKYGSFVTARVIIMLADEENYELAHELKIVLEEYCKNRNIEIPKGKDSEVEDFRTELWRLGLPGHTAVSHFPIYCQQMKEEVVDFFK